MPIRINDFSGAIPRLHPTKLPESAASFCQNVLVEQGILSPSKKAGQSFTSNQEGLDKFVSAIFFKFKDATYKKFSNSQVRFAFSPVHESYRLYWTTEDASAPLKFNDWHVNDIGQLATDGFDYIAGMPPMDMTNVDVTGIIKGAPLPSGNAETEPKDPATEVPEGTLIIGDLLEKFIRRQPIGSLFRLAASISIKSSGVQKKESEAKDEVAEAIQQAPENKEARVYAFTYVNRFGDESAPSVKEQLIYIGIGDKPVITISYSTGERERLLRDYGVTNIRLYRSVTNSLGVAQFLFIKEVAFTLTGTAIEILDDVPKGSLMIGEPLPTINFDPPRAGMKGLGVTDSGVGYAYVDKTICLSEPYLLYAWARYYELSSQHTIMGMGHYDNTIVVATTSNPILISGDAPEAMGTLSLPLYEGCVSARSMVNLNHGCMYASQNGLVLVTTNSAKLLTEGLLTTDDWQAINPASIHACAYKNGYLFFWQNGSKKGSGYIDLNNPNRGLMWFDDYALNTFLHDGHVQMVSRQTDYFNVTKSVYAAFNPEYGQAATSKKFVWRSKTFKLDAPKRMLAAQVIADDYSGAPIVFRVYAAGVLLHECFVSNSRAFRIKNHSVKQDFIIEVESDKPIRELVLGESMQDLIV